MFAFASTTCTIKTWRSASQRLAMPCGSRYLYICEQVLVHYCSEQRDIRHPLEKYTEADLDREYSTVKPCAPFCTVSCVHRVAMLDLMRNQPREALSVFSPGNAGGPRSFRPASRC